MSDKYISDSTFKATFPVRTVCDPTFGKKLIFSAGNYYLLAFPKNGGSITVETATNVKSSGGAVLISGDNKFSVKTEQDFLVQILFSADDALLLTRFLNTDILKRLPVFAAGLVQSELLQLSKAADNIIAVNNEVERDHLSRQLLFKIVSEYFCGIKVPKRQDSVSVPDWLEETVGQMKRPENFTKGISQMLTISKKTPEHLSRSMKKHFGITPTHFINELRMKNAAKLLIESDLTIMDICFENGYQNISWFNSLFKDTFSVSPREYREVHRDK